MLVGGELVPACDVHDLPIIWCSAPRRDGATSWYVTVLLMGDDAGERTTVPLPQGLPLAHGVPLPHGVGLALKVRFLLALVALPGILAVSFVTDAEAVARHGLRTADGAGDPEVLRRLDVCLRPLVLSTCRASDGVLRGDASDFAELT